jgi:hypothetical protein
MPSYQLPVDRIEKAIPVVRGQKVMLDTDLAELCFVFDVPSLCRLFQQVFQSSLGGSIIA